MRTRKNQQNTHNSNNTTLTQWRYFSNYTYSKN